MSQTRGFMRTCVRLNETSQQQQQQEQQEEQPQEQPTRKSFRDQFKEPEVPKLDLAKTREFERLRIIPAYPAFYGGNPVHDDIMTKLKDVLTRASSIPTRRVPVEEFAAEKFISFDTYAERCGSGKRVKRRDFDEVLEILNRLRSIDLQLMPQYVIETLNEYRVDSTQRLLNQKKIKELDEFGRAHGKAKRKNARAEVYMVRGEGSILVNGKPLTQYFNSEVEREKIVYPFQVIEQLSQYNVFATVSGGGFTGQSESIMYSIAKALVVFNPLLKSRLSKAGLMTSDARVVERKKPGKVKARKSPTWVKR
ncbi:37S ribosomal protein S9 mitochondrial [Spathaspora sp. JA1]|nr:37S ribosomal protein S9 mitochondrial [Spathaspora sp. JA1]